MRRLTLGLVQMAAAQDMAANLDKALRLSRAAAEKGAKVICLPELFRSAYFPQFRRASGKRLGEAIPGEATRAFSMLARELGVVIIAPLCERSQGGRLFNSAAVVDADGRLLGAYRKTHIPQDPRFYEKDFFEPGDRGFLVCRTRFCRLAALICYDQWFPEAARACALKGAEILFYPTAIGNIIGERPEEGDWREAWITIQRSHAIANSVHVASVNRVGREGKLRFWGTSFVSDAFGNILKRASRSQEGVLLAETDLSQNKRMARGWGFLRSRRPDCYGALLSARRRG